MSRPFLVVGFLLLALLSRSGFALDPDRRLTQYVHDSWTSNDGLPQDSINGIAQTPDGYLWLATQEGIARFDGSRFTVFDSRTSNGKIGNFVYTLFVDHAGILWAGSAGGLLRYDGNEQFTLFDQTRGWPTTSPKDISEDPSGALWAGLGGGGTLRGKGLVRFKDGRIRQFSTQDGLANDQVYSTAVDRTGAVWCGTGKGLSVLRNGRFETWRKTSGLPDDFIRVVRQDHEGSIWIGTAHGLSRFKNNRFTTFTTRDGLLDDEIYTIYEDRDRVLWIGTRKGVNRMMGGRVESAPPSMGGIANDQVFAFMEDREGSLWIGTHAAGLHRLRAGKFTPLGSPEGLLGENAISIYQDRGGRMWIGTLPGGLNVLDTGSLRSYSAKDGLTSNNAGPVLQDRAGIYWIGTGDGLFRKDGKRFTSFTKKDGLPDDRITALYEDRRGTLWIGTGDGLARMLDGRCIPLSLEPGGPTGIRVLHEDRTGRFWIGGGDGLGYLRDGRFVPFPLPAPSDVSVTTVHEDPDGTLWFGTWGAGIYRVKGSQVRRIASTEGLFDDVAWGIVDDLVGNFWVSSNRGIYRVSRNQLNAVADGRLRQVEPIVYGTADGMRRRECNLGRFSAIRASDGKLWFATTVGTVVIDPRHIRTNGLPPPVTLARFTADDRPIPIATAATVLPAGTRTIEFEYAALSFVSPSRVRYRYKLEGFDDHWIEAGTRRNAFYTNIDPGAYTFRVIAANDDGVWNETGATTRFRLRPFFYQTWWFGVLVVVALILLGAAMKELRARQIKIRHQVYHDPMTGMPNRRLLMERAAVALAEAGRRGRSIGVLFLDLDGFKGVNDNLGHAAGDQLLKLVAARFKSCVRDIDTLARIGGDEFAILLAELGDEARASEVAQRLIDAMRAEFAFDGHHITLGVSIGIALHPFDGTDAPTMLQAADRAMYRAKISGGNAFQFNAADSTETVNL